MFLGQKRKYSSNQVFKLCVLGYRANTLPKVAGTDKKDVDGQEPGPACVVRSSSRSLRWLVTAWRLAELFRNRTQVAQARQPTKNDGRPPTINKYN
jgi:hypothetical protein